MGRRRDFDAMRRAGRVVAEMHDEIRAALRPGVTTAALDRIGRDVLERRNATSNFLGYHGYPAVICASVNDTVVHGIPGRRRLHDGDLIAIDCGAVVDGWHADAAFSAIVGDGSDEARALVAAADAALEAAIAAMVAGNRMGDVGHAVESVVTAAGFSVVDGYCGHAIGLAMHEDPLVPNEGRAGKGRQLKVGDAYAAEPMVNAGGPDTHVLDDGWSVVTTDGSWSAHTEQTILVTDDGPEVTTRLP